MSETELDDFGFKPINDGLGFHRKPNSASADGEDEAFSFSSLGAPLGPSAPQTPSAASDPETAFSNKAKVRHNSKGVSDLIAALPPALDFLDQSERNSGAGSSPKTFLKMPIGREDYRQRGAGGGVAGGASGVTSSVDENLAKLGKAFPHMGRLAGQPAAQTLRDGTLKRMDLSQGKAVDANTATVVAERGLAFHFGSAILDTLVVLGVGCVLLAVLLGVTGANLVGLLENSKTDSDTILLLSILFVASGLLYTLAGRAFMGATLGEWSYEIRVGSNARRARWYYPLLVLWRGVLVAGTCFVFFPIVSALVGQDVLKWLTGLELVALETGS